MPHFKKIKDYTPQELDLAVAEAVAHVEANGDGLDFYKILNGIDAYFERRRRKEDRAPTAQALQNLRIHETPLRDD